MKKTDIQVIPGNTYRNSNGSDYFCLLAKGSYALFQEVDAKHPKFIVAWLPGLFDEGDGGSLKLAWQQGHYFETFYETYSRDELLVRAIIDFQSRTGSVSRYTDAPKLADIMERETTVAAMKADKDFAKHTENMRVEANEPVFLYSLEGYPDFWNIGERAHLATLQDWFNENNKNAE